jgi:hypothetical protein
MNKAAGPRITNQSMELLSQLLLEPANNLAPGADSLRSRVLRLDKPAFDKLAALANSNHVIVRGLERVFAMATEARDTARVDWAAEALAAERDRIANAISYLHSICEAFESEGYDVTVIKSLDHWPDIGSDLDLYTNVDAPAVIGLMRKHFRAQIAPRSWGDRLARKWNFNIPGLPEAVEVHVGRLGQTGEQVSVASSLAPRARVIEVDGIAFRVPSVSDRLIISVLQRMYRHFYFRLCDIVDSAGLVAAGVIDYTDLRAAASRAEIWEGVATYLAIVSDYVGHYSGAPLELPQMVLDAARFGGEQVYYAREFIRVPILPQSAALYRSQLAGLLRRGEVHSSARLGLLPWLATAAVVGQKITGSDKGIW